MIRTRSLRARLTLTVLALLTTGLVGVPLVTWGITRDAGAERARDRLDRFAAAAATSGTGLGLYLVREIARGHGGEVVYQPPVDHSPTTFLIRVPVAANA